MLALEVRTKPGEAPTLAALPPTATIAELKAELAERRAADGWKADAMNLILQGRFLDDDATLEACGIRSGNSTLVVTGMVPRVLPPMPAEEVLRPGDPDDDRVQYVHAPMPGAMPAVPESDPMRRV